MKHFNFSLSTALVALLTVGAMQTFGQSVSINATGAAPNAQSILDVSSTTKGVLLPRMTSGERTSFTPTTTGMTVYDITTESYWYWDDTANQWREIPNMTSIPSVSLDDAYDGGIFINADAGAVDIQGAGGLTVNGITGIGTTSPDANYKMTVVNGSGPEVKVGGTNSGIGLLVEANAGAEDGISAVHSSTSNTSAFYAIRGEVTNESGVGYLGYHTSGDNSYAVYGQSGTYAGYFDGNVNLTGELQLNGSPGAAGQVLVSQGAGVDPIWGAAGVQSVSAGIALDNSGTAANPVIDVLANNGLTADAGQDRVQLGGALTEATTITQNGFDMTYNLNGTGEFVVQDGGQPHFKIENDGDAVFGSNTYWADGSTSGIGLFDVTEAGPGTNDGRLRIYSNGAVNHTIHGDGDTYFNELGLDRNFRIDSDTEANMFFLDGGTNRIGIGIGTPSRTLHVDGEARIQGLANAAGAVVVSDNNGNINDLAFTGTATDVLLGTGTFGPSSAFADHDWYQTGGTSTPTAIGDWIYTNGNVGINVGSSSNPLAALHVQSNAYIGDLTGAGFFNSNAVLHIARNANPHLLLEDIGTNTGGFSFDGGGLNVVTENGDIEFKTGITFNGDFSTTGNTRMIIENGGQVGIGTATPDRDVHISATAGATVIVTRNDANTNAGETLGDIQFDSEDNTGPSSNTTAASAVIRGIAAEDHGNSNKGGHLAFLTQTTGTFNSPAEHMRITSAGNVGIGVTNPSVKFQVAGDATISGKFNSNGIQESSDARFKKDVAPLENALSNVMKIEGVSYTWKQDEFPDRNFGSKTEIGVIAQELEKVYPELVATDSEGYKSVQYSHLVPILIEAIKEQQSLISQLEADNNEVRNQLKANSSSLSSLTDQFNQLRSELNSLRIGSDVSQNSGE